MTTRETSLPVPTVGRIVLYRLNPYQVDEINRRRNDGRNKMDWHRALSHGCQVHVGNKAETDRLYPAMIVAVWGDTPDSMCNLQVFLDGNDTYWVTSVSATEPGIVMPGRFCWPTRG